MVRPLVIPAAYRKWAPIPLWPHPCRLWRWNSSDVCGLWLWASMHLPTLIVAACVWLRCADLVAQPVPGVIENSIGITLVLLQPGSFTMGEPAGDDLLMSPHRPHQVTLTTPFYMGAYEVTNAQWKKVMGWVPKMWNDDDHPVVQVSWEDATEFCRTLSAMPEEKEAGRVYRLPTEAEWEYACRAGTTTKWSFGNDEARLEKYGWFEANSGGASHRIGTKKPNAWGLYDMHGNVWELCSDRTDAVIDGGTDAAIDPQGPISGDSHVTRGGGWESEAKTCRSARRGGVSPSFREFSVLGFRLAMTPPGIQPADLKSLNARTIDLHRKGDYAAAAKAAEKAMQVAERDFGKDAVETATPINNLAALYRRLGKYAEAEPLQKRALAVFEKSLGADHPITAGCLHNLAILSWSQGKYAEAEQLGRRALAIREKALGPDHPDTVTNRQDLARMQQERAEKDDP